MNPAINGAIHAFLNTSTDKVAPSTTSTPKNNNMGLQLLRPKNERRRGRPHPKLSSSIFIMSSLSKLSASIGSASRGRGAINGSSSTSACSSTSKRSRTATSKRKKVRFVESPTYCTVPAVDESRKAELWITPIEFMARRQSDGQLVWSREDQDVGRYLSSCDDLYYTVCEGGTSNSDMVLDAESLSQLFRGLELGYRGLEKSGGQRRMRSISVVKKVVKAQPRHRNWKSASAEADADALRQYSRSLTQDVRLWAQIQGQADALVVNPNHIDGEIQVCSKF